MKHCNVIIVWIELRFNEDILWSGNGLFASDDTSFDNSLNSDIQQISFGWIKESHVVMVGAAFIVVDMSQNGEFNAYDNGLISITLIDAVNIASLSDNTSLHGL